jgi:hypothetical protein
MHHIVRRDNRVVRPDTISTGLPVKSAFGGWVSGAIARSNTAPDSVCGRSSSSAAALSLLVRQPRNCGVQFGLVFQRDANAIRQLRERDSNVVGSFQTLFIGVRVQSLA